MREWWWMVANQNRNQELGKKHPKNVYLFEKCKKNNRY